MDKIPYSNATALAACGTACLSVIAMSVFCMNALQSQAVGASYDPASSYESMAVPDKGENPGSDGGSGDTAIHEHIWREAYELIDHEAVTETVVIPAEFDTVEEFHTICNECGSVIDGFATDHLEETGHRGFTVNVPSLERLPVKDPYIEDVVLEEPYTEKVLSELVCDSCGMRVPVS